MDLKNKIFYVILFAVFIAIAGYSFLNNAIWLSSGQAVNLFITNRWDLVALHVLFFAFFLIFIPFKRKTNWKFSSIYLAFLIALFTEMYGFPLTVYFIAAYFGNLQLVPNQELYQINVFGLGLQYNIWSVIGPIVSLVGIILIITGWGKIYRAKNLVTDNIYSKIRHPQYLGIILVALGWFFWWTTLISILMLPLVALIYYKLAKSEDKELEGKFGRKFLTYKQKVPMFLPRIF